MPISADLYYQIHQPPGVHNKPPLVLIHGAGGNHLYWPANIRRLDGLRVFAVDLPGHGHSSGQAQKTIKDYAANLNAWLESLQIHQAILIGHSMGGAIVLHLALHQPDRVLAIGLVGSSAKLSVNPSLIESTRDEQTIPTAINKLIQWSFSPDTPPKIRTLAARRLAEAQPEVLHNDLLACQDFNVTDQLDRIRLPCQVICGEKDKMTPLTSAQYLAENIPGASLEIIPGAGHMVMLEQPNRVGEILSRFANQQIAA